MKLFREQKIFFNKARKRINLAVGSVRSGKSVVLDLLFVYLVPKAPEGGDIFLIGKTLDALKRNVINPLQRYLGKSFRHYPGKRECKLWNRTIHTVGANDERSVGKIQGASIYLVLCDEITLYPEGFVRMLDNRLSFENSTLLGSANPDSPYHYLKTDYIDREKELDLYHQHFKLEDNTFLSRKFIENIKKNYKGLSLWYRRFILGEWCLAEGAVYDFFQDTNIVSKCPFEPEFYVIGIDYGTGNPTAFIRFACKYIMGELYLHAEKEYLFDSKKAGYQKTDIQYVKDLKEFMKDKAVLTLGIYIDPSAASFILQCQQDGIPFIKDADNSVLDGIRTVGSLLVTVRLTISKVNCPQYINSFYGYLWDSKAQKLGIDKPLKENGADHMQDGGRYSIYTLSTQGIGYNAESLKW